jgi:hypothetical protein
MEAGFLHGQYSVLRSLAVNILMISAFLMGLVGIIGLLSPPVCQSLSYFGIRTISTKMRFPLGEVEDLAVDKNNNIVVYLRDHCRIQIYQDNGELLRGWFVGSSLRGARNQIHIDPNDCIHLATKEDKHYVFDIQGNLLREYQEKGIFEKFGGMDKAAKALDLRNNIYRVFSSFFRTHISKITPEGSETIVVSDPFYIWLFRLMFPNLFLCIFSSFLLICFGPRYGMFPDNWLSNFLKKKLLLKDLRVS